MLSTDLGLWIPFLFLLGPLAGYLLGKYIPDETQWYPKWMRIATVMFLVAAAGQAFFSSIPLFLIALAGTIIAGYFLYAPRVWVVAVCFGVVGELTSLLGFQLLTISAIFATSAFYSIGKRKELLYWVLTPILILGLKLLL